MKHKKIAHAVRWALLLVGALLLIASCGGGRVGATPGPSQTPVASLSVSPSAPTPSPSPTTHPQPTPTPVVLGKVESTFGVRFETTIDALPPGQYALIDRIGPPLTIEYFGLEGQGRGPLLSIDYDEEDFLEAESLIGDDLILFWESGKHSGDLIINIIDQTVRQIGTVCELSGGHLIVDDGKLIAKAFYCGRKRYDGTYDYDYENLFVYNYQSGETSSYVLPSRNQIEGINTRTITSSLIVLGGGFWTIEPPVCMILLDLGEVKCLDEVPGWWNPVSTASPDGRWVEVDYRQDGSHTVTNALIPTDCLISPTPDCKPRIIEDAIHDWGHYTYRYWIDDGNKMLFINYDVTGAIAVAWIYDLEKDESHLVARFPGGGVPAPAALAPDGEHFLFVEEGRVQDSDVYLVSIKDGSRRKIDLRLAPSRIVAFLQLP